MHKALGCGLGLRSRYYQEILTQRPPVDFFEIISEDYMVDGGNPLYYLDKVRELYPIVMHGVSMSIAGTDPLNKEYLKKLKALIQHVQPAWISDHCCWTGVNGKNMHDLIPVPYNQEALDHIAYRIQEVQNYLGQRIAIENVSSYVSFKNSEFTEWEFLAELCKKADCLLLLDINNIYVNSFNHGFDPLDFINGIPVDRVQQFHLAGHTNNGDVILDTHDAPIIEEVWKLFEVALKRFGYVSTLIERDDKFPPFSELLDEVALVRKYVAA